MFKSIADSCIGLTRQRFGCWCALALLASGGVAPLSAQSNGTLQYVDHLIAPEGHSAVLSTKVAFTDSYFDSEGNILPMRTDTGTQPFYLFTNKQIFYSFYDSQRQNTWFPLEIPFGNDISLSTASEVSYDVRDTNYYGAFRNQYAWMTGTRNSLYSYNITSRTRFNTITLRNEPTEPLFRPGNALVQSAEGVFMTNNGGIYSLSDAKLSASNGQLSPLVTAQGSGPGELNNPSALNVGPDGLLYVLDAGNHRIQKFEPTTGIYRGGFDLPGGLAVYSEAIQVDGNGAAVLDANGKYIYTNTSGNVFSTSLAISHEGHIYLGDGAGGGFVLNLEGDLLSTFHPPEGETGLTDTGLAAGPAGKIVGAGSFLTYDGYGTVFTYVEGKGLFSYRDPTYPMRPSIYGEASMDVAGDRVLSEGEHSGYTLSFQQGGKLTISDSLAIATGQIYMYGDGSIEAGGTLAMAGDVVKAGKGTLTLNNENTYSGKTIVLTGKLIVNGSIAGDAVVRDETTLGGSGVIGGNVTVDAGGILSPGNSPGLLTIDGDLTLSDSTLLMEFGGTGAGMFDQLAVLGQFTANGTLSLQILEGYTPVYGDTFQIFTRGGYQSGSFTNFTTNLGNGLSWNTSNLATMGSVTVVPEPAMYGAVLGLGLLALVVTRRRCGSC